MCVCESERECVYEVRVYVCIRCQGVSVSVCIHVHTCGIGCTITLLVLERCVLF